MREDTKRLLSGTCEVNGFDLDDFTHWAATVGVEHIGRYRKHLKSLEPKRPVGRPPMNPEDRKPVGRPPLSEEERNRREEERNRRAYARNPKNRCYECGALTNTVPRIIECRGVRNELLLCEAHGTDFGPRTKHLLEELEAKPTPFGYATRDTEAFSRFGYETRQNVFHMPRETPDANPFGPPPSAG